MKRILLYLLCISSSLFGQNLVSPLEKNNYQRPTTYNELSEYVNRMQGISPLLEIETIGQSVEGRCLYALKFSTSSFGKDVSKVKILIFSQQHGNEQSGKEGALLLIGELLKPENRYLLERIDLALIPQVNPDGSERNQRLNARNADLNRNHLILEEPEAIAIHRFFDSYHFDVTMDVHEYAPYFSKVWKKYGYRANADEAIGCITNCNLSSDIRDFSNRLFIPFYKNYLTNKNFTNSTYTPGGPPGINYFRHSTYDINDGRHSFGIQGVFAFIQEGLNGEDLFKERIKHRALGQMNGMKALLEFCYLYFAEIKSLTNKARNDLTQPKPEHKYAVRMKHVETGAKLNLQLYSYATGNDTTVVSEDYRPLVESVYNIDKPIGYLIPKNLSEIVDWINRQNLRTQPLDSLHKYKLVAYQIESFENIDFEGDTIDVPNVRRLAVDTIPDLNKYIFIPIEQLKGNLIITAIEPESELGLATYPTYNHLPEIGGIFPILRVENVTKHKKKNNNQMK